VPAFVPIRSAIEVGLAVDLVRVVLDEGWNESERVERLMPSEYCRVGRDHERNERPNKPFLVEDLEDSRVVVAPANHVVEVVGLLFS